MMGTTYQGERGLHGSILSTSELKDKIECQREIDMATGVERYNVRRRA